MIDNLVSKLDKGWVDSEKVRNFLMYHNRHGVEIGKKNQVTIRPETKPGGVDPMTTVLIVDDNPDIRDVFTTFLTISGFSTLTASGGEECLELLKKTHPDIILLDIMMEPMNGWETLTQIKNQPDCKDIPVFMVSGKVLSEDEWKKYDGQYKMYIMKPVTPEQLTEAIADTLK